MIATEHRDNKSFSHTTGRRAPQISMREKERINPIFADMFCRHIESGTLCIQNMATRIETLCTISCVKEESFASLNRCRLKSQPFDLKIEVC